MMQDMNIPFSGSYSEFSSGAINSHSHRKHKYSTINDSAPFDGYGSKLESPCANSEFFNGTRKNHNEDLWGARSSFLDDNFLNENEFTAFGRNWLGKMEGIDFSHYGNELPDNAFECPHLRKNRVSAKAADRYNISDSSSPNQRTLENNGDFIPSKMTRYPAAGRNFDFKEPVSQPDDGRYPAAARNFDFKVSISQPDWTYHEDARDNLSLLSEESCSSTAVRGEAKNKSPAHSTARQSRRPKYISGSDGNMNGLKNIYAKETQHQNRFDVQQGSYTCGSGRHNRISSPSNTKQFHFHQLNSPCQEILGPQDSLLFEEGYTSAAVISDFGSVCQTFGMKVPSFGSKPQTRDPFIGFLIPESKMGAMSSFDRSKYGNSTQYSSLGCSDSEKFPFCKSSHVTYHDPPICSSLEFVPTRPSSFVVSEPGSMPSASFHVPGSRGQILFPDSSVLESVSKDEGSKSKAQPAENKKFEPDKRSCSECKEANGGPSEQKSSTKTTLSSELEEETSALSVKNAEKFEHAADKAYRYRADTPLACQNNSEDLNAGIDSS